MTPHEQQGVYLLAKSFEDMGIHFSLTELQSRQQSEDVMSRRRLACKILKDAGFTLCQIAHIIGRKQHGSVLNMLNQPGWADPITPPELLEREKVRNRLKMIEWHYEQIKKLKSK